MLIVKNWKKLHQRSETSLISLCELRSSESISPSSLARALIYGIVIYFNAHQFSSVQFSSSVVSNSMRPHGSQHTRPPCPWGFSRQEYCSGLPFPSPGDLPYPGLKPRSPALQANSLPTEPLVKPPNCHYKTSNFVHPVYQQTYLENTLHVKHFAK